MVDAATVRGMALALPEVEEREHFGRPSFRVGGRIFVTLREDEGVAVVRLTEAYQVALAASEPATFTAVVWGTLRGWTSVRLDAVDAGELREIIDEGWRTVAPKRLVARTDGDG